MENNNEQNEPKSSNTPLILGGIVLGLSAAAFVFKDEISVFFGSLFSGTNNNNNNNNGKPNGGGKTPPAPPQPDQFVIETLAQRYKEGFSQGRVFSIYEKDKPHLLDRKIRLIFVYACYVIGSKPAITILQKSIQKKGYKISADGKIGNQTITAANKAVTSGDLAAEMTVQLKDLYLSNRNKGIIDENTYQFEVDNAIFMYNKKWQ
jgi:hypothetical protein